MILECARMLNYCSAEKISGKKRVLGVFFVFLAVCKEVR